MATTPRTLSSTSAARARVSGSDSGAGPGLYPGWCSVRKLCEGKFRLRSTSRAEFLVPATTPSGLSAGSSSTRRRGGCAASQGTSASAAATLLSSFPCTPPTTRSSGPAGGPKAPAQMGRPSEDRPTTGKPRESTAAMSCSDTGADIMMPRGESPPMSITLGEARSEARRLFQSGDYARALRAYDQILSAVPLDYEVRFKIADVLAKVGLTAEAAELYRTIALHDIRSGH